MKKTSINLVTLLITFCLSFTSYAQEYTNYDKALISMSQELASRIKKKKKIKVAVWDFTNSLKKTNALGDYLRSDFSIHFTNASDGMQLINRENLNAITKEHDLNLESGLIDPKTAKKVGMIHAADAIIIGTVDATIHSLRIRIKVIDTQTGFHFAAALRNIPIDNHLKLILKDTGFYKPIRLSEGERVSNMEKENDSRSTNKKCQTLKTGDYCFSNTSNFLYGIFLKGINNKITRKTTTNPNQNACFFDLPEGTYQFELYKNNLRTILGPYYEGSFRIEKCQSLTYDISETSNVRKTNKSNTPKKNNSQWGKILDIVKPIILKKN